MQGRVLSGIVVGGLLSLVAMRTADASCGIPVWLGTGSAEVPTSGSLYVHDESLSWGDDALDMAPEVSRLKIGWENGEGTIRLTRVESSLARLDYAGPPGATLVVHERWDEPTRLTLVPSWTAPTRAPRVVQYWHHAYAWTCSSDDTLRIQIDQPTAAVRVRWTVNGRSVDYLEATRVDETKHVLSLGKINCGGENVPLEQLYAGVEVELFAIRPDGSEVKIEGMPRHVRLDQLPASELDMAMGLVDTRAPAPVQMRAAREPAPGWLGSLVLVVAGLGLGGALLLIRRAERSASDCSPAS